MSKTRALIDAQARFKQALAEKFSEEGAQAAIATVNLTAFQFGQNNLASAVATLGAVGRETAHWFSGQVLGKRFGVSADCSREALGYDRTVALARTWVTSGRPATGVAGFLFGFLLGLARTDRLETVAK